MSNRSTSGTAEALRGRLAEEGLDWIVPDWNAPVNVLAISTTKRGGAAGAFDLGPARVLDAERREPVAADRARVASFLPGAPVYLAQVHGTHVIDVDHANLAAVLAEPPRADAAVTRVPGLPLAIRAADCLPVAFADRSGSVVGVAHAGWRGLAAGVLEATVRAMGVESKQVVAWIGPAIGPRAFEVGLDVFDAFVAHSPGDAMCFAPLREGKWLADLPALARRRLARAGVHEIAGGIWCTHGDSARFHSYRRDRQSGRMATVAWLATPA